jgi:hypothetical protein
VQSYPTVTDFLQLGLFRWAGDANSFKGNAFIELVCSPNNPDGTIQDAVLTSESSNGTAVHDLAYYWPQYTPSPSVQTMTLCSSLCPRPQGTLAPGSGNGFVLDAANIRHELQNLQWLADALNYFLRIDALNYDEMFAHRWALVKHREVAEKMEGCYHPYPYHTDIVPCSWKFDSCQNVKKDMHVCSNLIYIVLFEFFYLVFLLLAPVEDPQLACH